MSCATHKWRKEDEERAQEQRDIGFIQSQLVAVHLSCWRNLRNEPTLSQIPANAAISNPRNAAPTSMIRVLFVCLANVCRSPMAEAVFAHMVRQANLQNLIATDSAGTADWEMGSAAHPGTLDILERHGISYQGQSRALTERDLQEFDYIITMDDANLRVVREMGAGAAIVAPLLSFVADTDLREIPDPYFNNGFEIVYRMVLAGTQGLLSHIGEQCLDAND